MTAIHSPIFKEGQKPLCCTPLSSLPLFRSGSQCRWLRLIANWSHKGMISISSSLKNVFPSCSQIIQHSKVLDRSSFAYSRIRRYGTSNSSNSSHTDDSTTNVKRYDENLPYFGTTRDYIRVLLVRHGEGLGNKDKVQIVIWSLELDLTFGRMYWRSMQIMHCLYLKMVCFNQWQQENISRNFMHK